MQGCPSQAAYQLEYQPFQLIHYQLINCWKGRHANSIHIPGYLEHSLMWPGGTRPALVRLTFALCVPGTHTQGCICRDGP